MPEYRGTVSYIGHKHLGTAAEPRMRVIADGGRRNQPDRKVNAMHIRVWEMKQQSLSVTETIKLCPGMKTLHAHHRRCRYAHMALRYGPGCAHVP